MKITIFHHKDLDHHHHHHSHLHWLTEDCGRILLMVCVISSELRGKETELPKCDEGRTGGVGKSVVALTGTVQHLKHLMDVGNTVSPP